ncbi:UvrD-helicase domain-containing protein [Paenibacillus periandrae]|uniref:UvrD-helicase domain-containing protein n=1 Tax=Paenibacillus periandrae TaxID=1761741 RepID=UPI001F096BB7
MAAGISFTEPFTLVNAPAGSGKTTAISNSIKKLLRSSNKKILCITYTNRATEQLILKIDDERVDISTIHSFISSMMTPLFEKKKIVNYYYDIFGEKIERILNSQEPQDIERLEKYRARKEISIETKITKEILIENTNNIYYGETQFSSLLYGRLSHDDLLLFSKEVFCEFPKINKIISQKYSHVFIDEYQDTRSEILELFYNATLSTSTKLVLLGDEMQQIYNDRVEGFQKVLDDVFHKDNSLNTNWRSQEHIVTVLNNLYFDAVYKQENIKKGDEKPKLHIVKDMNEIEIQDDVLQLVLYNSELFDQIGARELYRAFNEKYQQFDKYSPKQILTDITMENPDELMIILIFITDIVEFFNQNKYGELIKRVTQFRYANDKMWKINKHSDKLKIHTHLISLSNIMKEEISLEDLLNYLRDNEFINVFHIDEIMNNINENDKFKEKIYNVKYVEFKNCYNECNKQSISTQHAVKGEGHNAIALKISDGSNPNVQMYLFLEIWSRGLFNYQELKKMNGEMKIIKEEYSNLIGVKLSSSNINNTIYQAELNNINKFIDDIVNTLQKQQCLYESLLKKVFETYMNNCNVTNFKKCLVLINKLEGIILAYKLFYVGCSRAKDKLDVYISVDKIKDFEADFKTKMESVGFLIEHFA